jgi:hypothetical protein
MQIKAGEDPRAIYLHLPGGKGSKTRGTGTETPPQSSRKGGDSRALPALPRKKPCHARLSYIEAKACLTWATYILAKAWGASKHPPSITTFSSSRSTTVTGMGLGGSTPVWAYALLCCLPRHSGSASFIPFQFSRMELRPGCLFPHCPITSGIRRICHRGIDAESPG